MIHSSDSLPIELGLGLGLGYKLMYEDGLGLGYRREPMLDSSVQSVHCGLG